MIVSLLSSLSPAQSRRAFKLKLQRIQLTNGNSFTLKVAEGWRINVAAEGLSRARFLAKSPDGRIFVTDLYNRTDNSKGAIYILDNFDPNAKRFTSVSVWQKRLRNPNSLAFDTDATGAHWLYIALTDKLVRYQYTPGETAPTGQPQTLTTFPDYGLNYKYGGWHLTRTVAIGGNGKIYVAVGSSCNACEETEDVRAAILELNPDGSGQRIIARGLRNAVGLRWIEGKLLTTNMGADHLGDKLPNDTMYEISDNTHYGWPYCYQAGARVIADPQFAASKNKINCREVPKAFASFIAHSSPLGFEYFDKSDAEELRDSFLVALHGSGFIRIGHGYSVALVRPGSAPRDFITGFLQSRKINGRPVDVMKFGDGFLLTDDYAGVVYFVSKSNR